MAHYRGLPLVVHASGSGEARRARVVLQVTPAVGLDAPLTRRGALHLAQLDELAAGDNLRREAQRARASAEELEAARPVYEAESAAPFEHEARFAALTARAAELEAQIAALGARQSRQALELADAAEDTEV